MSECPNLHSCPIFEKAMMNLPSVATLLKEQLCRRDYAQCARFRVFMALGKGAVPEDLYPTQQTKANWLISEGFAKQPRRPGTLPSAA